MQAVQSRGWFADLLANHVPPCVSMYFPASRAAPPADANHVHFKSLLHKVGLELAAKWPDKRGKAVLARLHSIASEQVGAGPHDGIAVFASPDYLQVIDLQKSVDDLCVVAESFHIKPLFRTLQSGVRFEILCFSPKRMRLLEGDQLTVTEVPLRNVPAAITETRVVPVQGRAAARDTAAAPAPLGHFIRMVDQAVWKNHSTISRLPLIVAADVKHLAEFLAAAKNPYVCKQGICHQPDHLSNETLRDEAWKILGPKHDEDVHQLVDQFRTAKAHHHGTDELSEVAEAAAHGRVGTLIVDANRHMPGVLHRDSGMIEQSMQFDPRAEDVLDDLAEMVLQMDGQVYVLPHEQMPTEAGVAAMFRY